MPMKNDRVGVAGLRLRGAALLWLLGMAAGSALAQSVGEADCDALERWIVSGARAAFAGNPMSPAPRSVDPRVWQVIQALIDGRHFEPVFRTTYAQMEASRLTHLSETVVPACVRQGALNADQSRVAIAVLSDHTRRALLAAGAGRPIGPASASPAWRAPADQGGQQQRPPTEDPPAQTRTASDGRPHDGRLSLQGRFIPDLHGVLNGIQSADELDAVWKAPARSPPLPRERARIPLPAGQMLECDYAVGSDVRATLRFWFRRSAPVGVANGELQSHHLAMLGMWDAVAHGCPATLRMALKQLGEEEAAIEHVERQDPNGYRQQLMRRFNAGQEPLKPLADDGHRRSFPTALVERGRDPATLQSLGRLVDSLGARAASIGGDEFTRLVRTGLLPLVRAVHAAAMVDLPDPKAHGPAAYGEWERRYARPLAWALAVTLGIRQVRADATFGMRPGGMNVPHQGFDPGRDMDLAVPLQDLFRAQLTWLEHHALTDRAWMGRAVGVRAAQGAAAADERRRRSERNDREIDAMVAGQHAGRTARTWVFEGTPGQVAAGLMMHQAGETAGNIVRFLALFNQAVEQRIEAERQLAASMHAFWRCYEARCDQGARLLQDYWARLTVRDAFDVKHQRGLGGNTYPAVGSWTPGFHDRHAATQQLCAHAYAALPRDHHPTTGPGKLDEGERIRRMAGSPQAQPWFACRDQVEFLLRPAGP